MLKARSYSCWDLLEFFCWTWKKSALQGFIFTYTWHLRGIWHSKSLIGGVEE